MTTEEAQFSEYLPAVVRRDIRPESRFVYVMQAGLSGPVKIGVAQNPLSRLRRLQTGCFARLRLIALEDLSDKSHALELEATLHRRFRPYQLCGEWFRCEGDVKESLTHFSWGCSFVELVTNPSFATSKEHVAEEEAE